MPHWSFYLVLLGTVAQLSSAINIRTMCRGYPYGTLLPNPQDCNSYYVCQSGPELAYCDHGLHFDRVHKVCNWPNWANCKLEDVNSDVSFEQTNQSELVEEIPEEDLVKPNKSDDKSEGVSNQSTSVEEEPDKEQNLNPSVEDSANQSSEEANVVNSSPDSLEVIESFEKPFHPELSKEPVDDKKNTFGIEKQIVSSLAKPGKNPVLVIEVPVAAAPVETPNTEKVQPPNATQVIKVHVVVPAEIPNLQASNDSKPSLNLPHVIQVPVAVPPESPNLPASVDSKPTNVIKVPVLVPGDSFVAAPEKVESPVPVLPVVTINTIPIPQAEVVVEKVESSDSVQQAETSNAIPVESSKPSNNQTLIPMLPVEIPNVSPKIPYIDVIVEKVESSKPSKDQPEVIELSAPEQPAEAQKSSEGMFFAEVVVEKVESSKPSEGSNQVIELTNLASPIEVPNTPSITPEALVVVEKVEFQKPTQNSNQVIELPVPVFPFETVVENSNPAVEKVEILPEEVVEQSVQVLLENVPNTVTQNNLPQAVVEKVENTNESQNPSQLIEVLRPGDVAIESQLGIRPAHQDSSQSSESIQLSQEDPDESLEESIPNKKLEQSAESKEDQKQFSSSEEHLIDSNSMEEPQVLPESSSVEDPTDYAVQVDSESIKEDKASSEATESSEEVIIKPYYPVHKVETSVGSRPVKESQASFGLSSEEDSIKPYYHPEKVETSVDSKPAKENQASFGSSSEEDSTKPLDHHHQNHSKQSKEDPASDESSFEENAIRPQHHHHQSNAEKVDSKPSKEEPASDGSSSEEISIKPLHLHHHYHHQSNVEKVEKPSYSKPESSEHIIYLIAQPQPNEVHEVTPENQDIIVDSAPFGKPFGSQAGSNSENLIVSILSVGSFQGNGSTNGIVNRPIVGAHSIDTGHPIDVMTGYNSKNVQCIHDGLYFLPHPSSCQMYFICAYRHLHLHSCGSDLFWSYKREQCEVKSDTRCYSNETLIVSKAEPESPVSPSKDGSTKVTEVTKGTMVSTPMPPLRTTQSTAATQSQNNKLPLCPAIQQVYLPSLYDCNKYYICILGEPVLMYCPDNMHWDAKGEFCGEPTLVRCAGR